MIKKKVVNGLYCVKDNKGDELLMTKAEALMLGIRTIYELANKIPWATEYSPFVKEHSDHFEILYKIRKEE